MEIHELQQLLSEMSLQEKIGKDRKSTPGQIGRASCRERV